MKKIKYILFVLLLLPIVTNAKLNNITLDKEKIFETYGEIYNEEFDGYEGNERDMTNIHTENAIFKLDKNLNPINKISKGIDDLDISFLQPPTAPEQYQYTYNYETGMFKYYDSNNKLIKEKKIELHFNTRSIQFIYDNNYIIAKAQYPKTAEQYHIYIYDKDLNLIANLDLPEIFKMSPPYTSILGIRNDYVVIENKNGINLLDFEGNIKETISSSKIQGNIEFYIDESSDILLINKRGRDIDKYYLSNQEFTKEIELQENGYEYITFIGTNKKKEILVLYKKQGTDIIEEGIKDSNSKVIKYNYNLEKIGETNYESVKNDVTYYKYAEKYSNLNFIDLITTMIEMDEVIADKYNTTADHHLFSPVLYEDEYYALAIEFSPTDGMIFDMFLYQSSKDFKELNRINIVSNLDFINKDNVIPRSIYLTDDGIIATFLPDSDAWDEPFQLLAQHYKITKNEYSIDSLNNKGGQIIHPINAKPGEKVEIKVDLDEGYVLSGLYLIDELGNKEQIEGNSFIMPEHNVTIEATFNIANPETSIFNNYIILLFVLTFIVIIYLLKVKPKDKFKKI